MEAWRRALAAANAAEVAKNQRIHEAKTANVKEMFALNRENMARLAREEEILKAEDQKRLDLALEMERQEKLRDEAHTAERAAVCNLYMSCMPLSIRACVHTCVYMYIYACPVRFPREEYILHNALRHKCVCVCVCVYAGGQAFPGLLEESFATHGGGSVGFRSSAQRRE